MVLKTTKGSTTDNIAENVQQDIDMQCFGSAVMQNSMMGCERYTQNREIHVRIHHLLVCHTRQQRHLQDICRTYPTG
jgi:hypothetical protein